MDRSRTRIPQARDQIHDRCRCGRKAVKHVPKGFEDVCRFIHLREVSFLKSLLARVIGEIITSVPKSTRHAMKFLAPIIEERLSKIEEYGKDYPDKPVGFALALVRGSSPNVCCARSTCCHG